eukprot:TRINITY_DN15887_c0_g1_i1.p1 TRINITY_DN15887_c0_g1~~TRINITY_DN15887_c0_g1_i1.p1  ORF type:complete len:697 (+),score=18.15 TRINITY_DN15887_c0_g1_i1:212-2092(+)
MADQRGCGFGGRGAQEGYAEEYRHSQYWNYDRDEHVLPLAQISQQPGILAPWRAFSSHDSNPIGHGYADVQDVANSSTMRGHHGRQQDRYRISASQVIGPAEQRISMDTWYGNQATCPSIHEDFRGQYSPQHAGIARRGGGENERAAKGGKAWGGEAIFEDDCSTYGLTSGCVYPTMPTSSFSSNSFTDMRMPYELTSNASVDSESFSTGRPCASMLSHADSAGIAATISGRGIRNSYGSEVFRHPSHERGPDRSHGGDADWDPYFNSAVASPSPSSASAPLTWQYATAPRSLQVRGQRVATELREGAPQPGAHAPLRRARLYAERSATAAAQSDEGSYRRGSAALAGPAAQQLSGSKGNDDPSHAEARFRQDHHPPYSAGRRDEHLSWPARSLRDELELEDVTHSNPPENWQVPLPMSLVDDKLFPLPSGHSAYEESYAAAAPCQQVKAIGSIQHPRPADPSSWPSEHALRQSQAHSGTKGGGQKSGPMVAGQPITTFQVMNIPLWFSHDELQAEWPPRESYNLLYLPMNLNSDSNYGYAYLNCVTPEAAEAFRSRWHGQTFVSSPSDPPLKVTPAKTQGFEATLQLLRRSKVLRIHNPKYKPLVFINNKRVKPAHALAVVQGTA